MVSVLLKNGVSPIILVFSKPWKTEAPFFQGLETFAFIRVFRGENLPMSGKSARKADATDPIDPVIPSKFF